MSSVDQQIATSRAQKKALIKKTVLGLIAICLLVAAGILVSLFVPSGNDDETEQEQVAENVTENVTESASVDRKALQELLTETNETVAELVDEFETSSWQPDQVEAFETKLEYAYTAYGAVQYAQANALLTELNAEIEAFREAYVEAYTNAYQQALQAFEADEIAKAATFNAQALAIHANYDEAQRLQQRIDVYDEVADWYEQARVGAVENNLAKQQQAYQQIVQLDPQREDARQQLTQINETIKQTRFADALAKAVRALDAEDFDAAQTAVNQAAAIDASRSELLTVQARLDAGRKRVGAAALEQQLSVFITADEWATVKLLAERGQADYPDNAMIRQANQSADEILTANRTLDGYLNRPERLSDLNIRDNAIDTIARYSPLTQLSAKLGDKIAQLESLIEQENQPIGVIVRSDNNTFIRVLGVGNVGEVREKTIQLKPGRYKFEGTRPGYRSVIVEVVVERSDADIVVDVQCTEQV